MLILKNVLLRHQTNRKIGIIKQVVLVILTNSMSLNAASMMYKIITTKGNKEWSIKTTIIMREINLKLLSQVEIEMIEVQKIEAEVTIQIFRAETIFMLTKEVKLIVTFYSFSYVCAPQNPKTPQLNN